MIYGKFRLVTKIDDGRLVLFSSDTEQLLQSLEMEVEQLYPPLLALWLRVMVSFLNVDIRLCHFNSLEV